LRLVTFYVPGKGSVLGCETESGIIDLHHASRGSIRCFADLLAKSDRHEMLKSLVKQYVGVTYTWEDIDIVPDSTKPHLLRPLDPPEIWAAGVTYERSRKARMEESGYTDFYDMVYRAERPELFFKDSGIRTSGPNQCIGVREDSHWMVPEPELGLVIGKELEIIGYTVGNDVSSRDIEGANPLYLPQAKIFQGCCAIGPAVVLKEHINDPYDLTIVCEIFREGERVFEGSTSTSSFARKFDELVKWLGVSNPVLPGTVLLTGTSIVPPDEFSLKPNDTVEITIEPIGRLRNYVLAP